MHQDIIIGAGITGLTLAFYLSERGRDVVLVDASKRAGGMIRTVRRDGLVIEHGPQSLQVTPELVELIGRLGLRDKVIGAHTYAKKRYVLANGQLVALPSGLAGLFQTPLLRRRDALRLFAEPFIPRRSADATRNEPESVFEFASRRLGRGVAEAFLDPFVAGVFGGNPRGLDVRAAFPDLVEMEQGHGSIIRGGLARAKTRVIPDWVPGRMLTLRNGLETLTDTLAARLGPRIQLQQRVLSVQRNQGHYQLDTTRGTLSGERLWVAIPSHAANPLFPTLQVEVPHAPISAIHLVYPREEIRHALRGFGWLAPPQERKDALGCLWVSSIFPGHAPGYAMLRVMVGGTRAPQRARLPEDVLVAKAQQVLAEVQGIHTAPVLTDVATAVPGIPQYPPGFATRVDELQGSHPNLKFLGWGYTGIGISKCILAGHRYGQAEA